MGLSQLATYGILTAAAVAALSPTRQVIHERRDVDSQNRWVKRDRISARDVLPMRIGLTQRNLERGAELLKDVSDPTSSNYGKHWTKQQVAEMFEPSKETIETVKRWLGSSGITTDRIQHSRGSGWLAFNASVAEAENLLQTEYYSYDHSIESRSAIGCDEYQLPHQVRDHVDFIHPAVALLQKSKRSAPVRRRTPLETANQRQPRDLNNSSCYDLLTPACIRELYNVPIGDKAAPGNTLGIFEYGSWYSPQSLDAFFGNYSTNIPQGTRPANVSIDISAWHYGDLNQGVEADMDVQIAFPLIYPQNITIYQSDDDYYTGYGLGGSLGWFQDWLDAIDGSYCTYTAFNETGNNPKIDPVYPDQHRTPGNEGSTSPVYYQGETACGTVDNTHVYSVSYGDIEGPLPTNYIYRQCNEFMKLGLMGTTVVVASGDSGTSPNEFCNEDMDRYHTVAQYPVNRPWYQDEAVESYNKKYNRLPKDAYNAAGRGFPDVSAVGWNMAMFTTPWAEPDTASGTSASTPIVASLINRVNEERLAVGKSPVGFVNPIFYKNPHIFNDVVSGNNSICGSLAYNATPGWDPTTGLGTINYPKMLEVFLNLP
ncbi:protease s8 tripeptidyl peptidase [Trichoderma arundinaceum]|uniref:Protease s8 tripeptidyl peptidase n=1 Tax=Trichoderma arundinaceum TaxID=490622 RepID=A0A395NNE7_TRIAR|nr:protease s8 tripeptidyl peptidase [Trichoderma arundinaceum]